MVGSASFGLIYKSGPINRALQFTRKDGDPNGVMLVLLGLVIGNMKNMGP